jgi:outer membrane receptor protein involved in Fe transport
MHKLGHLALTTICSAVSLLASAQTAQQSPSASATGARKSDDGTVQTVTITATKRLQNIRDVPQTVEAFSQSMLEDMGAKDISDVVKAIPGVELRATQPGSGGVAIRGVTELNVGSLYGGTGSATGLYVDEIPVTAGGLFPELNTFDLERVEVLKGPQGTLFGEGSLAGTIRLITRKPDLRELGGAVEGSGFSVTGGGKGHKVDAMVNVPVFKDVAGLRITVFDRDDPGYIDTRLSSNSAIVKATNTSRSKGGRLVARVKPTAQQTLDLTLMTSDATRGGTNRATDDFVGIHSVLESAKDKINTGNATWQLAGEGADYTVTASKMKRTLNQITDQLSLVTLTNQLNPAFGLPPVTGVYAPMDITTDTTALEVRAVSNAAGPLKWTVGAFYKKHDRTFYLTSQSDPLTPPAAYAAISQALTGGLYSDPFSILSDTKALTKQTAVFGETSYDLSPAVQVSGGLRLFEEKRSSQTQYGGVILYVPAAFGGPITPPGDVRSSATDRVANPRISVSFKPAPGVLTYASASRGFRSGGQNDLFFSIPGGSPTYASEKLTSYELGLKADFLARTVFLDAAVYALDWSNLQTTIGKGPGGAGEIIGNIGNARSTGLDLAIRARPASGLELQAGISLIDAKTRNAVTLPDPQGNGTIDVPSGARIPRTAKQSANLAVTYRRDVFDNVIGLLRLGVAQVGDSISYLYRQDQKSPAHTSVDLKLGLEGARWSAYLYATNLTNSKIELFRETFNEPGTTKPLIYWGQPRTVGLNLRYSFE